MRFLRSDEVPSGEVVRTFRHSAIGPLMLSAFFSAPLVALVSGWATAWHFLCSLTWFAWIAAGPVLVITAGIWWICLAATRAVVYATFLPSNWLVKTTRDGLYLQLRSYQNHHFTLDVPTVAYFAFDELASVRRAVETFDVGGVDDRRRGRRTWLEFQLNGVDTAPLSAWLAAERARPAPRTRTLGVESSTRFDHTPVVVPRAGVVYVDWLGRGLLRAIGEHVATAEDSNVALDAQDQRMFETRVNELVARGEHFAAIKLARKERKLSLTEAHSLVKSVRERGASSANARS